LALHSLSNTFSPFTGDNITEWFMDLTELWHETGAIPPDDAFTPKGMLQWIHYHNYSLWHLEDDARRTDLDDAEIVRIKRTIDKHNQQRNDGVEQIDIWIDNVLSTAGIKPEADVEGNSEPPGYIIDRLSILCLKIYHMQEQADRKDLGMDEIEFCSFRTRILSEQRNDLAKALDKLILDLRQANKKHKLYRQFKLYNDPRFNPSLYNRR
jgi:hypothetical protein